MTLNFDVAQQVRLYADEQFPLRTVQHLRQLGYDVLTVQEAGNANQAIPDDAVLAFATQQNRAVLTLNRRDFIRLHQQGREHAGIVVCKDDRDKIQLAETGTSCKPSIGEILMRMAIASGDARPSFWDTRKYPGP